MNMLLVRRFRTGLAKPVLSCYSTVSDGDPERINFENHRQAFQHKTLWEISRGLFILKLCSYDRLVNNSMQLMDWTQKAFGQRLFSGVMKPTFYRHFVGGCTPEEMKECVRRLGNANVRPMIAPNMEEEEGSRTSYNSPIFEENYQKFLRCLDLSKDINSDKPMMQVRVTGIVPADLLVSLSKVYQEKEGRESLVANMSHAMETLDIKDPRFKHFSEEELEGLRLSIQRMRNIVLKAIECGVTILVDAEFKSMNPGMNLLTLALMNLFNRETPRVWITYQCYLRDVETSLLDGLNVASSLGCHFGVKLVRGAYMLQEKERAEHMNYPNPVCDDYETACKNYNKQMCFLLEHVVKTRRCKIIISTHNRASVEIATDRMKQLGLSRDDEDINFAQIYGMCDQITFPLANAGYNVYKSIPYGPLAEVLPYLARRAIENKSVLAGARDEKQLLVKAFKERMFKPFHTVT